jgi:DNA repair protein RecN (Recombination protein N)
MLLELHISDFAIIEQLHLRLDRGFTVLTGETGAGKSIIIDALGTLRGEKVGSDFVRAGSKRARVEGVFSVSDCPGVVPLLKAYGLWGDDDGQDSVQNDSQNDSQNDNRNGDQKREQEYAENDDLVILTREINAESGRSVARINRRAVNIGILREIGEQLVDIHGQHEGVSLFNTRTHLDMLDRYGSLLALRERVGNLVLRLRQVREELDTMRQDEAHRHQRIEDLRLLLDDVQQARLSPDEEQELVQERSVLQNAARIAELVEVAYNALHTGDESEVSPVLPIVELMGQVMTNLEELATLDPAAQPLADQATDLHYRLEDLVTNLRGYRDGFDFNPERLDTIEDRLFLIRSLQRKYGSDVATLLERAATAEQEIERLSHSDTYIAELETRERAALNELGSVAGELSQKRYATGQELSQAIEGAMGDLAMPHVRFAVHIVQTEDPQGVPIASVQPAASAPENNQYQRTPFRTCRVSSTGVDHVEFLISPNPGEPLKPLARIASGGESSRLLLALKSILSRVDAVPTLIFDEVDVGVGGRAGQIVGQKLWAMTDAHQVICITHLPQVAAFAENHYAISKRVVKSSSEGDLHTRTEIRHLTLEERVSELAAMLDGVPASPHSRASAREMIERATMIKNDDQIRRKEPCNDRRA